jgi:hypothetical protein
MRPHADASGPFRPFCFYWRAGGILNERPLGSKADKPGLKPGGQLICVLVPAADASRRHRRTFWAEIY